MGRRAKPKADFDRELSDLPPGLRRREYMMRVEAVIFAASRPVSRETLSALIGSDCNLDLLIADIRDELRTRPYELVDLSPLEQLALTAVAYFQPITRMGVADILGKPVSRDAIAALRGAGLVATGPRSPQPGAPYTYVTTPAFLQLGGLPSLRDLPDLDRLEAAGLLGTAPLPEELRAALGITDDAEEDLAEVETDEDDMAGAAFGE